MCEVARVTWHFVIPAKAGKMEQGPERGRGNWRPSDKCHQSALWWLCFHTIHPVALFSGRSCSESKHIQSQRSAGWLWQWHEEGWLWPFTIAASLTWLHSTALPLNEFYPEWSGCRGAWGNLKGLLVHPDKHLIQISLVLSGIVLALCQLSKLCVYCVLGSCLEKKLNAQWVF